jgi:hypothetical protein
MSAFRRAALKSFMSSPKLHQRILKACLLPSYAGHYLPLENAPTIAWWTVFQVTVLHTADSHVFAFE